MGKLKRERELPLLDGYILFFWHNWQQEHILNQSPSRWASFSQHSPVPHFTLLSHEVTSKQKSGLSSLLALNHYDFEIQVCFLKNRSLCNAVTRTILPFFSKPQESLRSWRFKAIRKLLLKYTVNNYNPVSFIYSYSY